MNNNSGPPKNHFDRLYASIFEGLQSPEAIEWFPTYNCNSKCQYCGGYDQETKKTFGPIILNEKIKAIIKESYDSGVSMWNIGGRGGEPLLYPNLAEVLGEIKKYNMNGILITNGLLLEEEFIKRLVQFKWDVLRISLDSHIPDIHDKIRGISGNFSKVDVALDSLNFFKKMFNTRFPEIISCPVVTNNNYEFIPGYIEYCKEKGVDEIQFMPLIDVHERASKLMLSNHQKEELAGLLKKINYGDEIKHNIPFLFSLCSQDSVVRGQEKGPDSYFGRRLYCIHLWKTLVISEDGYLSPCSLIKDKLFKIQGSLLEAWDSGIMNELRKRIFGGEIINPLCKDCCGPLRQETENFNQYLLKHP